MTHTAHNCQMMFDASRKINKSVGSITDIHTKINLRASATNGMISARPFYKYGLFRFKKRY